jgi:hypothetical protein
MAFDAWLSEQNMWGSTNTAWHAGGTNWLY